MDGELGVAVVEPHDHAERDHVVAHRVDERAAELAVLCSGPERPAHRVNHPLERPRDLPDLLHAERPDLRVVALQAEAVERDAGEVALRSLTEDGHAGGDVGSRLEVGQRLAVAATALVAGADAANASVGNEELLARGLGQDRRACFLGALGQPPGELRERGDVISMVLHGRRSRDADRRPALHEVDGLGLDLAVERHVLDGHGAAEEPPQAARVDDRPRHFVRSGLLALLQHSDGHVAQSLRQLRLLLEELAETDCTGQAGRAGTDDQDTDVDPLVGWVSRHSDELGRAERRRVVRRPDAHLRCSTSWVSLGTTSFRSPTTPRSANSKIGAFGSLLIAITTPDPCMPTLCWIAPEMPHAM